MRTSLLTSTSDLTIHRATPNEAAAVYRVFEDVIAWLQSLGSPQWSSGEFAARDIAETWMVQGEVYLVQRGAAAVATVTLYHTPNSFDRAVWGDVADDATYLHKLAVRRTDAGHGIGAAIVRWAERVAAERGKRYLRLDTGAESVPLRRFYDGLGYTLKGIRDEMTWKVALYEKKVR